MQREALRAANMLHAEGVLLMEEARAAAAAILALRDNTARPLMAAGPVFLHADGSRANAGTLRAGLGSGMRATPVLRAVQVRLSFSGHLDMHVMIAQSMTGRTRRLPSLSAA